VEGLPALRRGDVAAFSVNGVHDQEDVVLLIQCRTSESEARSQLVREVVGPNETRLTRSRDHYQNFLDSVRSRRLTITPAEVAHRSASVGHLGVIAIETGRTIRWDPATETLTGDPAAERLLSRAYRRPYQIPA
jgi:PAS domain-containing protein